MRKTITLAATLALGLSLTACGGSSEDTTTSEETSTAAVVTEETSEETSTPEAIVPPTDRTGLPPATFSVSTYQATATGGTDMNDGWATVDAGDGTSQAIVFGTQRVAAGGVTGWTQMSPDWPLDDLNTIMNGGPVPEGYTVTTTEQGVPLVLFQGEGSTCTNYCVNYDTYMAALMPDPSLTGGEGLVIGYFSFASPNQILEAEAVDPLDFEAAARTVQIVP